MPALRNRTKGVNKMDLNENQLELKILTMLKDKLNKGDKEIALDIFEEKFGRAKSISILESLKDKGYVKYECESALIMKKGLDKLKE